MDLRAATSWLLRTPDPAEQLKLADSYIQAHNRLPEKFILPAAHANLKAVIEAFASDTNAFANYIRALRDASDGKAYDDLHELYRMISMRALQAERRARIRKAITVLMRAMEPRCGRLMTYEDQLKIARFVEQRWGAMRLESMAEDRRLRNSKRLSSEERNIALQHFWRAIDRALDEGSVPLGSGDPLTDLELMLKR